MRSGLREIVVCLALLAQLVAAEPVFEKDVFPILQAKCVGCHGPKSPSAGLDLHQASLALRGGAGGAVIVKGSAEKSLLYSRVKAGTMPPGKVKLTGEELDLVKRWIDSGAATAETRADGPAVESAYKPIVMPKDRKFWSFRPLENPVVPTVRNAANGPVDAFLLAALEGKGLHYSNPASPVTLIRRAYLDLIGLPPTPAEVKAFAEDRSPDAFAKVVDRLLASPQFGERWGRYWLDLAGYVDVVGRDVQATGYRVGDGRWRYRDYVVQAFQQDKPFNQFLREQIAGDELSDWRKAEKFEPAQLEQLIATGFLRTAEDPTDNAERDTPLLRYEVLHQTVEILTSSVMGLTVGCARCHNHKFDPIPQRDYYRIMATLTPSYNPDKWTPVLERTQPVISPVEAAAQKKRNQQLDAQIAALDGERTKLIGPLRDAWITERMKEIPEADRKLTQRALEAKEESRNPRQKTLVEKFGKFDAGRLPEEMRGQVVKLDQQIASLKSERKEAEKIECLYDTGAPPETYIHRRGDFESKGLTVGPGGLEVLDPNSDDLFVKPPFEGTTGRRLALANWLTAEGTPASALVTRVYVNRAWSHLFGQGLVTTSDNFGAMGSAPSHPQLLEWLAREFQRNGWQTKPLLRTLMLSRAYQQSSLPTEYKRGKAEADPEMADPENKWIHRMRLKRLESEAIRDSMLSVSGTLQLRAGGPPIKTIALPDGMVVIDQKSLAEPSDKYRRSIYLVARRRYNLSLMGVFDHPVMSTNATSRGASAVVLQSLMMMNDGEVHEQSLSFADRLHRDSSDWREEIGLAFRYAFSRTATEEELQWSGQLYNQELDRYKKAGKEDAAHREAMASVCHMLLNATEFLYVE